ncbi:MAG: rhodanese family protein [Planctomycetota bacterium]
MQTISIHELRELLAGPQTVRLVDVRTPAEYRAVHVRGAELRPLDGLDLCSLEEDATAAPENPGNPPQPADPTRVYLICKQGKRSRAAAARLMQCSPSVAPIVVEGGTDACVRAGLDVVQGRSMMSLERQVRIGAGALVALGTGLGVLVHPTFLILPAFVGCGLVFAGVTNTCGMGMLLTKMPWNR